MSTFNITGGGGVGKESTAKDRGEFISSRHEISNKNKTGMIINLLFRFLTFIPYASPLQ